MNIDHDFSKLTLISSAGCNLSCDYCVINKNKSSIDYSNQMQKQIIKAFQDGSFLNNTKKIYQFFNQDFSIVKEIELWGQEPTLTLPYITMHLEDWLNTYSNCKRFFFSTNMGNNPDIIFDFIKKLNEIIQYPYQLNIQISYDGVESCKNERGIDPNLIKENYLKLINKINQLILNNLNINFSIRGVINFKTIYNIINDNQAILNFIQDFEDTQKLVYSNIQNIGCKFNGIQLVIEYPHDSTSFDGKNIVIFLQKLHLLSNTLNLDYPSAYHLILQTLKSQIITNLNWKTQIINQLNINNNPFDEELLQNLIYNHASCGVFNRELKITYNGTLLDCLNNIFNTEKEQLNKALPLNEYDILNSFIDHKYYINPLLDNTKDIQNTFNIYDAIPLSFLTLFQSVMNIMILLLDSNQIDYSYKNNKEKLLKHTYYITQIQYCIYNRYIKSGSHYLTYSGICRLYGNGLLDLIENYQSNEKRYNNGIT